MHSEMCAQLRACQYAIVRNRVTVSLAARSAGIRPKQRYAMGRIDPFESRRPTKEV